MVSAAARDVCEKEREEEKCESDVSAWGETLGSISVYSSSLTISERASECNVDVNLALWLQVHLQTHKQTHCYISVYSKSYTETVQTDMINHETSKQDTLL